MPKKQRTQEERTIDPAAQEMLYRADELGIGTAFSRADEMVPCNIGSAGMCCKICSMGPCRLVKPDDVGICMLYTLFESLSMPLSIAVI